MVAVRKDLSTVNGFLQAHRGSYKTATEFKMLTGVDLMGGETVAEEFRIGDEVVLIENIGCVAGGSPEFEAGDRGKVQKVTEKGIVVYLKPRPVFLEVWQARRVVKRGDSVRIVVEEPVFTKGYGVTPAEGSIGTVLAENTANAEALVQLPGLPGLWLPYRMFCKCDQVDENEQLKEELRKTKEELSRYKTAMSWFSASIRGSLDELMNMMSVIKEHNETK